MLIAITFFAAALHLGYKPSMPWQQINLLFIFSFFLFYSTKHFIFIYHPRKKVSKNTLQKIIGLGILIILLGCVFLIVAIQPIWTLIVLICFSALDNIILYKES